MMQIQCIFSPAARLLIDLNLTLPEGCTVFDAFQCLKLHPDLHDHLKVLETSFEAVSYTHLTLPTKRIV